jgi:hypothetical protein
MFLQINLTLIVDENIIIKRAKFEVKVGTKKNLCFLRILIRTLRRKSLSTVITTVYRN